MPTCLPTVRQERRP